MATSPDSCENSSQTNDDLGTTESDTELQNIFRKLRVNHRAYVTFVNSATVCIYMKI